MAILLTPVHLLVILLHSCPPTFSSLLVLSDSRPSTLSSSGIVVLLSFSRILGFSDSRILGFSSLVSSSCSIAMSSPIFKFLAHFRPPYQLHIQLSTAVQRVFPIHSCFNSSYCCHCLCVSCLLLPYYHQRGDTALPFIS